MKKLLAAALLSLSLFADAFIPLHSNLVGELLSSDFVNGGSYRARKYWSTYQWQYFPYWNRLKFYVPGGTVVSVQAMAGKNIPIRFHLKFKEGPVDHTNAVYVRDLVDELSEVLLDEGLTAEFATFGASAGTAAFGIRNYTSEGGWVYFYLSEDPSLTATVVTSITSFETNLVYSVVDEDKFVEWLYNTPLLSEYGNPSAFVPFIEEINDVKGEIVRTTIPLDQGDVYYDGPNPFETAIDVTYTADNACLEGQTYVNGECIDTQINSNVTSVPTTTTVPTTTYTPVVTTTSTTSSRTCPEGTEMNSEGVCVASTTVTTTTPTQTTTDTTTPIVDEETTDRTCPEGTEMNSEGVCVAAENVVEEQKVVLEEVVRTLENRALNVDGYFAYYGPKEPYDPYAWVYMNSSGTMVAKLEGMDPATGYLKWTELVSPRVKLFDRVDMENGNIVFGRALLDNLP